MKRLSLPAFLLLPLLSAISGCGVKKPPTPLYATPQLQETPSPTPDPGDIGR